MEKSEKKVKQIFTWKVFIIASILLSALLLFIYIAEEAVIDKEKAFDDTVIGFFDSITSPGLIKIMEFFTFLGSTTFLIPFYILLVTYFLITKDRLLAYYVIIITSTSTLLFMGLKILFHRPRPEHPVIKGVTGYSFPSGHSLSAFVFGSIIIYIVWQSKYKVAVKWLLTFLIWLYATAIGISRIVLKVHYPTDVMASFCVGLVWVILSLWILEHYKQLQQKLKK